MRNILIALLVLALLIVIWHDCKESHFVVYKSDYAVELGHLIGVNRAFYNYANLHGGKFPLLSIADTPEQTQYKGACLMVNVLQDWGAENYPILYFGGANIGDSSKIIGAGIDTFAVSGETERVVMFADGKTRLISEKEFLKYWTAAGLPNRSE